MKYDFKSVSTLVNVRTALRELLQKISEFHNVVLCQTDLREISVPLRNIKNLIDEYVRTANYDLLREYASSEQALNFFRHFTDEFKHSLTLDSYTIHDVLCIMKIIGVATDEMEQEIENINEKYFS